jgi:hypothetical protein
MPPRQRKELGVNGQRGRREKAGDMKSSSTPKIMVFGAGEQLISENPSAV